MKPSEFSTGPSEGDSIPLEISPQNGEEISSSEGKRKRPIGEILAHSGLITRDQLAQALDQQARTGRKIGEILIANRWITEQSFQNALKDSGKKVRIGEILVEKKIIDEEQLEKALAYQKHNNKPLGESLLELGFVEEHALLSIVSRQLGIQYLDVSKDSFAIIDPDLREYLPDTDRAFWTGLKSLPIFFIESLDVKKGAPEDPEAPRGHLSVVMFDPLNRVALEKIEKTTRCIVNAYVCNANAIKEGIELLYSSKGRSIAGIDQADATKHTRYLNKLLYIATLRGASDIHIEPNESEVIIRMRVNGHMRRIDSISMDRLKTIVNVIKTSANLDISKRFVPQDGSFTRALGGHVVDVRVSTMPYIHGERCVLRVLLQDMSQKTLFDSNLPPRIERQLVQALSKKNGVILVTGPTGSGKTTTLHRALHQVASERTNVVTVEDPVEYRAGEYVNQSSINETRGFTYPVAIRSILRQDPDVILVGEIRDKETANIATEAALTGHLVLSTLHTEDSLGSIVRLIQLGVAEWLISSTVVTVLNQRLIRRFCDCAEYVDEFPGRDYFYGREIDDGVVDFLEEHWDRYMVKRAVGCKKCDGEGYKGMQVVVEQLSLTSTVRDMIREGRTYREVIDYIRERHSMNMIFEEGFRQVLLGVTAFEELRDLPRGDYVMKSPDQIIRDATETVEVRQVDLDPPERKRTTIIIDPSSPLPQGACSAEDTLPLPPFTGMNEKSLQPVAAANAEITEVTGLPGFVGMKNGPPPTGDGITEIMGLEAFTGVSSGSIRLSRTVEHPESHAPVPQPHAVTQSQPLFLPAPEVPDVVRIVPREHTIIVKALVTARADQEIQRGLNELIRNKTETVLEAYYRYRGHPEIWTKIPGIKEAMETMKQDRRTRNKVAQRIEVSTEAVERLLKEVPIAEDTDFDK